MSIEATSAAGGAIIKIFGIPVLAGAVATALAFLFMWPKTMKEAFIRFTFSILFSGLAGPFVVFAVHSWWPALFDSAKEVAKLSGADPALGILFVGAPLLVISALPAWWIIGGLVRWFDKRKDQDLAQMAGDAAHAIKEVRSNI
jgi:hypothetical protein